MDTEDDQPTVIYVRREKANGRGQRFLHLYKERPAGYDPTDGWTTFDEGRPLEDLHREVKKAEVVWLPRGGAPMPMLARDVSRAQLKSFILDPLEETSPLTVALEG